MPEGHITSVLICNQFSSAFEIWCCCSCLPAFADHWGMKLTKDLLANMVAPIICNVWQDMALRAGYSGPTVESWVDQFDTMLVIPRPGEIPQVTACQEAMVFLSEWHRTTEDDTLQQIVHLMKEQDLIFELNLMLWALYSK